MFFHVICDTLRVSQDDISRFMHALAADGAEFEIVTNKGTPSV